VVLTLVEIFLAYKPMPIHLMLIVLLGLSIIKAALIVAYFMHLKFERLSLILTIVPMLVVCIMLLFVFFPDSFRSAGLRYQFKESAASRAGAGGGAVMKSSWRRVLVLVVLAVAVVLLANGLMLTHSARCAARR
jgi:cytochrome c oxidase subunit 4